MKYLLVFVMTQCLFVFSSSAQTRTLLEVCTEKKMKDYKAKNLVPLADEKKLMDKFMIDCSKTTFTTAAEKQKIATLLQAAERERIDREAKEKLAKVAPPPKPITPPASPTPPPTASFGPAATPTAGPTTTWAPGQPVFGGCGTQAQCEAYMREANTPKYTWSSPGLQVYLGELWGNSFNYASGLGGTFEQPKDMCNPSNQGQIIALDIGTEVIAVSCMSSFATQEEIKAMALKIKNTKIDTLGEPVIAVKKPKFEWKEILKSVPIEGQNCFCRYLTCTSDNVGQVYSEHSCCGTAQCIRIDGGPVKEKQKPKAKPDMDIPKNVNPPKVDPSPTPATSATPAAPAAPELPRGFDPAIDGAAGGSP